MALSHVKTSTVLIMVLAATVTLAHEGNDHIKGVVAAIGDNTISVQTVDKQTKVITFDQQTKFQKANVAASAKDLKVGDRVVIDIHEMGGKLHATVVRFGATKPKAGSAAHAQKEKH